MKVFVCNSLLCVMVCLYSQICFAGSWFVAVNGLSTNSGSFTSPWSLSHAFSRPNTIVLPGDTIYIRGGVYKGTFSSNLKGSAALPVTVQNYPNESPILMGDATTIRDEVVFTINGSYTHYKGLEITTNGTTRISAGSVDPPLDMYTATGVYIYGPSIKLINCSIHDCQRGGIGYWSASLGAEVYGCIIFNNGYSNNVRGHGPNLYVQNIDESKPKQLVNSFVFNGFSIGVQFYSSSNDFLRGFIIDSCTVFNAGANTKPSQARRMNLLAGGANSPNNPRVRNFSVTNSLFYRDTTDNTQANFIPYSSYRKNVELGTEDESLWDISLNFSNNTIYGDPTPLILHRWDSGTFKNNFIYAYRSNTTLSQYLVEQPYASAPFSNWDYNSYNTNQPGFTTPFGGKTFAEWKTAYGVDSNATFTNAHPVTNQYFVRRNRFEPHKYYITVQNYLGNNVVALPLSNPAFINVAYAVFDVQYSLKIPIDTGTYLGTQLLLPINQSAVTSIVGTAPVVPKHSSKTLGTFIVEFYPEFTTTKAGNWADPTIWDNGKVPQYFNKVTIRHNVSVTANAWCKSVDAKNALVTVQPGVLLNIGQQ